MLGYLNHAGNGVALLNQSALFCATRKKPSASQARACLGQGFQDVKKGAERPERASAV